MDLPQGHRIPCLLHNSHVSFQQAKTNRNVLSMFQSPATVLFLCYYSIHNVQIVHTIEYVSYFYCWHTFHFEFCTLYFILHRVMKIAHDKWTSIKTARIRFLQFIHCSFFNLEYERFVGFFSRWSISNSFLFLWIVNKINTQ